MEKTQKDFPTLHEYYEYTLRLIQIFEDWSYRKNHNLPQIHSIDFLRETSTMLGKLTDLQNDGYMNSRENTFVYAPEKIRDNLFKLKTNYLLEKISEQNSRIEKLEKIIENMILYQPEGEGYEDAKKDYQELLRKE